MWSEARILALSLFVCLCILATFLEKEQLAVRRSWCLPSQTRGETKSNKEHGIVIANEVVVARLGTNLGAESLKELIDHVYGLYGVRVEEVVVAITQDNCSANAALAKLLGLAMIGCLAHKFNLACRDWQKEFDNGRLASVVANVNGVMKKSRTLKNHARLQEFTPYTGIKSQVTRWSAAHRQMERFALMENALVKSRIFDQNEDVEIGRDSKGNAIKASSALPSQQVCLRIREVYLPAMTTLNKWMVRLQHLELTVDEGRNVFMQCLRDPALRGSPKFDARLKFDHKLTTHADFESGLLKILTGMTSTMDDKEKEACKILRRCEWPNVYPSFPESDRATMHQTLDPEKWSKALKKKKARNSSSTECSESVKYIDCRFIAGTSVEVEVLFSMCGHIMGDERRHMQPVLFESLVFLKRNAKFWDKADFNAFFAMKGDFREIFECDEDDDMAW